MRSLKVMLLPLKRHFQPWCDDVIQAIGDNSHQLSVFDPSKPISTQFDGIDVVIDHGGSVGTRRMMDVSTSARLWQILGTGFDHFDLEYIRGLKIPVANCPGQFSSAALAESAMMFILMLARRYRKSADNFASGVLYQPLGSELANQSLGIIGLGASGQELARRAKAFGMKILVIDVRVIEPQILAELQPDFMGSPSDIDQIISEVDFLSLHLHLNSETRHIIDARRIALMKPTAYLINVARGGLVDEQALYQALVNGKLGGSGLDVFTEEPPNPQAPVFQLPNVVVTPHVAGATYQTSRQRAACAAQNVDRIAQELEPFYRIDKN